MKFPSVRKSDPYRHIKAVRKELRSLKFHLFLLFTLPAITAAITGTALREYFRVRKNGSGRI